MSEEKLDATIEKETGRKETGRIEAFSDGVFAVAITLLVFNLKVPQIAVGDTNAVRDLGSALLSQWPSYLAFVTSFATILIMWVSHHSIFKMVYKSDSPFLFANGLLLMLVTVVPFPTALVAAYLTDPAAAMACAVYAGLFVLINIAYNLLWWTASHNRSLSEPGRFARSSEDTCSKHVLWVPHISTCNTVSILKSLSNYRDLHYDVDLLGIHIF